MTPRDRKLAARARRHGARRAYKTVRAARVAGLPLSWAFALVEQESAGRNVFGHDHGSILHGRHVTSRRVRKLLDWINAGGVSNGVGLTQLTWPPYIRAAEEAGGAHRPIVQLAVGFKVFQDVTGGNYDELAWKYNGAKAYQAQIAAKERRWHDIFDRPVKHRLFRRWMLNSHPGTVTRPVKRAIVRAVNHGLYVTSTTDGGHAPGSWHYVKPRGRAVDVAHADRAVMVRYQINEHQRGAGNYRELFGPDNEHWVKNGREVDAVEGTGLEQQHDTHVHVAV